MEIDGNTEAVIQIRTTVKNELGEDVGTYIPARPSFYGWLDLSGGDSKYTTYHAKIQESTHIFVCDYFPLVCQTEEHASMKITPENSRLVINSEVYEVMLYDNPMNMGRQLEIYLKYTGGQ